MPPIDLDSRTRDQFLRRIEAVGPESVRQWGKMTAPEMFAHIRRSFAMTFGEEVFPDESNFILRHVFRPVFFCGYVPWPKGRIPSPSDLIPLSKPEFEAERLDLTEAVRRFCELAEREPRRVSPHIAFGPLTMRQWSRVHGMHIDHHLRQFGC